jgi:non-canonical poly(A) RNA polymerase PAPD5/7
LDPTKPPGKEARVALLQLLRQVFWANINKNPAYTNTSIRYSRYPLIAIQDRKSGLDVQIVLSNNSSVSREYMRMYMEQHPYLRPLFSVVKTMFDIRGLSDAFYGGFGSYALFMMVVASIKHKPHSRNDAAGGLVNFLRFWRNFDTTAKGISVDPVELYDKETTNIITLKAKDRIEVTSLTSCSS